MNVPWLNESYFQRMELEVTDICRRKRGPCPKKAIVEPRNARGRSDESGKGVAASLPCGTGKRKAEGKEENGRSAG